MKLRSMFRAIQHAAAQAFTPHQHFYSCAACRQILQSLIERRLAMERYGMGPWDLPDSPEKVRTLAELYLSGAATVCTPGGTISTNLGLCSPAANEVGWAAAINNNWTILDALFSVSGKLSTPNGGTGLASPATGSLVVGAGGSPMTALSIAAASSILMSTGSTPFWSPPGQTATIATLETRTSNVYGDLATVGPTLTMTPSVTGNVLVLFASLIGTGTSTLAAASVALSGGNTLAASDNNALSVVVSPASNISIQASTMIPLGGLANSSTTFTAKYRGDNAAAASFQNRRMTIIPF